MKIHKITEYEKKPLNKGFFSFLWFSFALLRNNNNYLLENCGALRAALRPYFLRSLTRASRVNNPAAFNTGL